jgi:hypothetical protein
MDRSTNTSWWQYGAQSEAPDLQAAKRMDLDRLKRTIDKLGDLGVL